MLGTTCGRNVGLVLFDLIVVCLVVVMYGSLTIYLCTSGCHAFNLSYTFANTGIVVVLGDGYGIFLTLCILTEAFSFHKPILHHIAATKTLGVLLQFTYL